MTSENYKNKKIGTIIAFIILSFTFSGIILLWLGMFKTAAILSLIFGMGIVLLLLYFILKKEKTKKEKEYFIFECIEALSVLGGYIMWFYFVIKWWHKM